jgi:hypothetical protein
MAQGHISLSVLSRKLRMRPTTSHIRSADASDELPNFMTKVNPARAFLAPAAAAGASSVLTKGAAVDPVWQRTARPLLRSSIAALGSRSRGPSAAPFRAWRRRRARPERDFLVTPGKHSATTISGRGWLAGVLRCGSRCAWHGTGSAE